MSRRVYTYTDLTRLTENDYFRELSKCPQITISADLRKGLVGKVGLERAREVIKTDGSLMITEFQNLFNAIDEEWNSEQTRFKQTILISEFLRNKIVKNSENEKMRRWLTGCIRNESSILKSIRFLEQAFVRPEDFNPHDNNNLKLFIEIWKYLIEKDQEINNYREKFNRLTTKEAWEPILNKAFMNKEAGGASAIVFHGFYCFTPTQDNIIRLLEEAGYNIYFLIPYDARYPFVYKIWDNTYSKENGFPNRSEWIMGKADREDVYGEIFEGKHDCALPNKVNIQEYASVTEFVNDVKKIQKDGYSLYSASENNVNDILKDYFPEEYGERKILAYPVGQFIDVLNSLWDDDKQTVILTEDNLIECFSSGWLSLGGVSGKQYLQDLMYLLPFFEGCNTISEWRNRIQFYDETRKNAVEAFRGKPDEDPAISRWQEVIENPLGNFSMFSVEEKKANIIIALIKQVLSMAETLFDSKSSVKISEQLKKLDDILQQHEISDELYDEERSLVKDIFEKLDQADIYEEKFRPADISRAITLFINGKLGDEEVDRERIGLVKPLYFIEPEGIKNLSRAHICFCDVDSTPGKPSDYPWPLSEEILQECYDKTKNPLINDLCRLNGFRDLCNRYFFYSGMKNKAVCISWVKSVNDQPKEHSPYITLLCHAAGLEVNPSKQKSITYSRVANTSYGQGRTEGYERDKAPKNTIKEARMDYALCPMKYVLGYVLEKRPVYQSDFQQNYALNALISAIYDLAKDKGVSVDQVYKNVIALFPYMRKSEKRQVYDYLSYDRNEEDMDYQHRSECGGLYYTDERLKICNPNQDVRDIVIGRFGKLATPDGRKDMNLYEELAASSDEEKRGKKDMVKMSCIFCPHSEYCRNAIYAQDQESYYD